MTKKLMKLAVLTAGLLSAVPMVHAGAWSNIGTTMESYDPEGKAIIGCGALLVGTAAGLVALHSLGWKRKDHSNWLNHYCAAVRDNTVAIASAALAYSGISRFVAMYNGYTSQPSIGVNPVGALAVTQPSVVNVTVENAQVTMPAMTPAPVYTEPVKNGLLFKGFPRIHKTELYQTMKQKAADFFSGPAIEQTTQPEVRFETPVAVQTGAQAPVIIKPRMFETAQNWVSSQWNSLSPNTQTGVMVGAAAATLATGMYAYKKYADHKHMRQLAAAHAERLAAQRHGIEEAVAQAQRLQRRAGRRRALGLPEQPQARQLHVEVAENHRPDIEIERQAQVLNGGPVIE